MKVSPKGQVVIPGELRRRYGIKPGSRVQIIDNGRHLVIVPLPDDPIAAARGILRWGRSVQSIKDEMRREEEEAEKRKKFG